MTLPVSGAISFNAINVELGVAGTTQASLGQASYRTLARVASGAISLSNFYGKSNTFTLTISANTANANLATLATAAGWNGSAKLLATINAGVYVYSNATGTPALTISGSFPGGVTLTNNGNIVGMGGAGGTGGTVTTVPTNGTNGSAGGTALSVSSAVTVANNGTIAGGGGGGGAHSGARVVIGSGKSSLTYNYNGAGGGGGRTGLTNSAGGAAGAAPTGIRGASSTAGGAGTSSSAGAGGTNADYPSGAHVGGGAGGGWGATGSSGDTSLATAQSGGSGGNAVTGNANITWTATGTRYGTIA